MPKGVYKRASCEDRFQSRIHKNINGCWDWLGSKDINGYARFNINAGWEMKGHRYAYIQKYGDIPDDKECAHTCRYKCVNPDHIEIKSHKDNCADKIRDGTYKSGPAHHRFKA